MPIETARIRAFLATVEGKQQTQGYIPCDLVGGGTANYKGGPNPERYRPMGVSGVTVGTGVDLGQTDAATLVRTVGVQRTDIEDDNLGVYTPLLAEMGYAAATHPDELVFGLLGKGVTTPCYDGQNFFDTDHPVFPEVDGTGAATTVSNLIDPAAGDPLAAWYILDASRPLKPLIFQERTKPELLAVTDPKQDHVFTQDEYLYGVRYRCNAGFGFWQQAVCCRDTLNAANFGKALALMQGYKADGGRPLALGRGGKSGTLLVVPSSLYSAALDVVGVQLFNGGESNKYYDAATIINCAWL